MWLINLSRNTWPHPNIRAEQFYERGRLISLSSLSPRMTNQSFLLCSYIQLRHFLEGPQPDWSPQTTPFESMCLKIEPQRCLISDTYALLFADQSPKSDLACRKWEQDLDLDLSDIEWENIYIYIHKGMVNVLAQENAFKIDPTQTL